MRIIGIVKNGKNKGEKIGFPTINLALGEKHNDSIESGVYAGKIFFDRGTKKVAVFIDIKKNLLEAYILDFSENLRGKNVEIEIGEKIRDTIKFANEAELILQIGRDVEKIRDMA